MTIVTTSRKPVPGLRTFSKDLAFALGARYTPRGKAGLYEVLVYDTEVIVVSKQGRNYLIQLYVSEEPVASCNFTSFVVDKRENDLVRGLRTGNQTVYEGMGQHLNVIVAEYEGSENTLIFDGVQRRRYLLRLTHEV
ncbi:MAG: hypothetical protein U9N40_02935 [Euryarchaeota archaeon]|nr:hypothetical protein [Euryarchaeota archaeon]